MTMLIALDENQNLIHINEALRGLACKCTCFECGEIVLARKGEIKEHHFAHASLKDSCNIQPESVLHKYAKDVILQSKGLMLPEIPNTDIEAMWWEFDNIVPEFPLGKIRPDLVSYFDGEPILIEIAVTHFVDKEKIDFVRSMGFKLVEIDLSALLSSDLVIPSDEVKRLILENLENKRWLYPQVKIEKTEQDQPSQVLMPQQTEVITTATISSIQTASPTQNTWEDYRFTINGIWVNARRFSSGMVSVSCTYNPEMIALLKQWKNEGRGKYIPQYKSWNYWLPFSEVVLERLTNMDCNISTDN